MNNLKSKILGMLKRTEGRAPRAWLLRVAPVALMAAMLLVCVLGAAAPYLTSYLTTYGSVADLIAHGNPKGLVNSVFFPAGDYKVTGAGLTLTNGVMFSGQDMHSTRFLSTGSRVLTIGPAGLAQVYDRPFTIRDLRFRFGASTVTNTICINTFVT